MSRIDEVLEAYETWDPDRESSTELAERLGISKARLYQILDKEGVTPKARRPRRKREGEDAFLRVPKEGTLFEEMVERGVQSLLDELEDLREEVAEYRERFGPLEDTQTD